ncbi:hypothetical protein AAY473_036763 [Plecturocebus cupreus]
MMPEEKSRFPTDRQAVPSMDPSWDPDSEQGDWSRRHLFTCKLGNAHELYNVIHHNSGKGRKPNSLPFLELLWEAVRNYIPLSPDSIKGQLMLKGKFIMQSAADIRRKFQKLALGPEQSLESLLNLATSVFYNGDQEEKAERDRREKKKAAALTQGAQKRETLGLAASLAELAITATYRDTLREIVPRGTDHLLILAHCAKGITGRYTVPGEAGSQGLRWLTR